MERACRWIRQNDGTKFGSHAHRTVGLICTPWCQLQATRVNPLAHLATGVDRSETPRLPPKSHFKATSTDSQNGTNESLTAAPFSNVFNTPVLQTTPNYVALAALHSVVVIGATVVVAVVQQVEQSTLKPSPSAPKQQMSFGVTEQVEGLVLQSVELD